ncbi:MAG TPA: hypothetical protein VGQ41_16610 [Pyrinomonadaceae bacterium]|nr:hypothetical protein [Pyrinomonadaceae bacterium]
MRVLFLSLLVCVFSTAAPGQARNTPASGLGSICIAPPDRPTAGEKSLANPAGGNRITTYSVQIDKLAPVVASNTRPTRISSLATNRKHLVKIFGDGKLVTSFRMDFTQYKTKDLCLFFKSLYETWSLWGGKEGRAICSCK